MSNIPLPWLIILLCVTGIIILWQLWFWLIIFFVSMTISKKKEYSKPSKFYNWIFVLWYRYMMIAGRLNVHVSGYEKVPLDQRFLLVSNHCSKFDNFIQCAVLKKTQIAYISKPENFKIPMGGRFMRRGLYLPIERDNAKEGLKTILKAIDYIKDDKVFWTMSPSSFSRYAYMYVFSDESSTSDFYGRRNVRPVITLKNTNIIDSGQGSINDPYIIKTE